MSSTTIPTQPVAQAFSVYNMAGEMGITYMPILYQPYVNVDCWQPNSCSAEAEYVGFIWPELNQSIPVSGFTDLSNKNRTVSQLYPDTDIERANTTTVWATHSKYSIIFATSSSSDTVTNTNTCPMACSVDARRILSTSIWSLGTVETQDYKQLLYGPNASYHPTLSPELMIHLTGIIRTLLPSMVQKPHDPLQDPVSQFVAPAVALMMSVSPGVPVNMRLNTSDSSSGSAFWAHQSGFDPNLSLATKDWLAHDGKNYDDAGTYFNLNTATNRSTVAFLDTQVIWTNYGFSPRDMTVKLSLAVMFAYVLVVLAFLAYSLYTGYAATSWDSIADLVALALNSQPPDGLDYTSAGIQTLNVFRKPVRIRVADDEACELVFPSQGGASGKSFGDVGVNKKY